MKTYAVLTALCALALGLFGCSAGKTVTVDGTDYNLDARLKVYETCALDAGIGAIRGIELGKSLEGQPTVQAVEAGLTKVVGSTIPTKAAGSCGLAVRVAQQAIAAGKAAPAK